MKRRILAKRRKKKKRRGQNTHIKEGKVKGRYMMFYYKCLETKKRQNRTMSHSLNR